MHRRHPRRCSPKAMTNNIDILPGETSDTDAIFHREQKIRIRLVTAKQQFKMTPVFSVYVTKKSPRKSKKTACPVLCSCNFIKLIGSYIILQDILHTSVLYNSLALEKARTRDRIFSPVL